MDIFGPNQRLIMLQGMENDNEYALSNDMLQRLLTAYRHKVGLSHVNEQVAWLEAHQLVTTEELENGIVIAKLTPLGLDVSRGLTRVEGVERPKLT